MKKLAALSFLLAFFGANMAAQCWSLVWQDDFNGSALNTADWNYWVGPAFNNELQYYTARPENVAVSSGNLQLIARQEAYNGYNYTSGRIDTRFKVGFTYGRVEGRMKLVNGQGLWPAFWLLPVSGEWPAGGEMDIMELLGQQPNKTYGTCHYVAAGQHTSLGSSLTLPSGSFADGFHTFALEWSPTDIKWLVDGAVFYTVTKTQIGSANWPFSKDFYVILNFAVGGSWPGPPNGQTVFPSTMEVDWVKIYQKNAHIKITGSALCEPNTAATYRLPTWAGATYNWSIPAGSGSIASGQSTSQITVNWGAAGDRTVTCAFQNSCGSRTVSLPVKVSSNLWSNPSFESGTTDWFFHAENGAAGTFTSISNSGAPNGTKIARVVCSALGQNFWDIQLNRSIVPVQKDTSYTLRYHARASTNGKQMQVNFLNPTNYTNYAWLNSTLTTAWVQRQLTFTAPYTGNLLFTQDFGFQTGTFYLDNYWFGRTSQAPPLAPEADERGSATTQIWPNPVSDALHIMAPADGRFRLVDMFGRTVAAGDLAAETPLTIAMQNFAAGVYFVEIEEVAGGKQAQKILKQ